MMRMSPHWTFRFIPVETVWIDSYLIHSQSLLAMKRQELTDEQRQKREELKERLLKAIDGNQDEEKKISHHFRRAFSRR